MSEQDFDSQPIVIHRRKKEERDSQPIIAKPKPKATPKKPTFAEIMDKLSKGNESKTALTEKALPPLGPDQPHDSAYTHSALKEKHTLGVLPTLNSDSKGNSATYILIGLLALTFFSAWGVAYEAQILSTPHIQGQCPSPAVIEKGGCFNIQTSTGSNGNTITTLIPAGHLGP